MVKVPEFINSPVMTNKCMCSMCHRISRSTLIKYSFTIFYFIWFYSFTIYPNNYNMENKYSLRIIRKNIARIIVEYFYMCLENKNLEGGKGTCRRTICSCQQVPTICLLYSNSLLIINIRREKSYYILTNTCKSIRTCQWWTNKYEVLKSLFIINSFENNNNNNSNNSEKLFKSSTSCIVISTYLLYYP